MFAGRLYLNGKWKMWRDTNLSYWNLKMEEIRMRELNEGGGDKIPENLRNTPHYVKDD
jgi:hypothetical protein